MYGSLASSSSVTRLFLARACPRGRTASISSRFSRVVVRPSAVSGLRNPKSTLPSLIQPFIFVYSPCFRSKCTEGYFFLNSIISGGSQLAEMLAKVPILMSPPGSPLISFLFSISSLWALYMFLIYGRNSSPSGESSMPRFDRRVRVVSSSSSRDFIIWLTADWV